MKNIIEKMKGATCHQKKVIVDIKNGIVHLEGSLDTIGSMQALWKVSLQQLQKWVDSD